MSMTVMIIADCTAIAAPTECTSSTTRDTAIYPCNSGEVHADGLGRIVLGLCMERFIGFDRQTGPRDKRECKRRNYGWRRAAPPTRCPVSRARGRRSGLTLSSIIAMAVRSRLGVARPQSPCCRHLNCIRLHAWSSVPARSPRESVGDLFEKSVELLRFLHHGEVSDSGHENHIDAVAAHGLNVSR